MASRADEEWIHDTVTRKAPPAEGMTLDALRPVPSLAADEPAEEGETERTAVEQKDDLEHVKRLVQALAKE